MLSSCEVDTSEEPLDIASNPLQLGFGASSGFHIRGSLAGNFILLGGLTCIALATTRLCMRLKKETFVVACSTLQLPGLLHIPIMFLLQPIVASSVWCVQSPSFADVALGACGLVLGASYSVWVVWISTKGRRALYRAVRSETPSQLINALPPILRRVLLGFQNNSGEWKNGPLAAFYVERTHLITSTFRGRGREWFIVVEMSMTLCCGVLGGVALTASLDSSCAVVLPSLYLGLLTVFLMLVMVLQPYNESVDHVMGLVGSAMGCVWSVFALVRDDDGAATVAQVQLWLGVSFLGIVGIGILFSPEWQKWLKGRLLLTTPTTNLDPTPATTTTTSTIDVRPRRRGTTGEDFPRNLSFDAHDPQDLLVQQHLRELVIAICDAHRSV